MRALAVASLCLALSGACIDGIEVQGDKALNATGSWNGFTAGTQQHVTMELVQDDNAIAGDGTISHYGEQRPFSILGSVIGDEITFHITGATESVTCDGVVTNSEISCGLNGSGFENEILVLRRDP